MRTCLRALSFLTFLFLFFPRNTKAASLSVTMSVGLTYFQVDGYTSPGAQVILKEGGSVIGTTTASSTGSFTLTVSGYDGTYTYTLYATDVDGASTESLTTTVSLTPGNITTLSGLVLPPTYHHNGLDQEVGSDIIFSGMAVPDSYLLIIIDNTSTLTSSVGNDGRYTLRLTTDFLSVGTHQLILKNQLVSGATSDPTLTLALTLRAPGTTAVAASASPSPSPATTAVKKPWWLAFFDFNRDDLLSLAELKDILERWLNGWLASLSNKSGNCDLNQDKTCNLVDLSILLYYIDRKNI